MNKHTQNLGLYKYIILHLLLGGIAGEVLIVATLWAIVPLVWGIYKVVVNRNRQEEAICWMAYYVGLEMVMRITGGGLFSEMGKYSIILFCILGEYYSPRRKHYFIWILFLILLLPSIMLSDNFESVRFALSGPIALAIGAYYLMGKQVRWNLYRKFLYYMFLPILSLCVLLIIKTPDFSEITFTANSTFATTGGFGPVHVSAVLGVAILVLLITIFIKQLIFPKLWMNYLFLFVLSFRLLLSFARSGLFALICSFTGVIVYLIYNKHIKVGVFLKSLCVAGTLLFLVWIVVNDLTGGMAYNRYSGRNTVGEKREDITTGRGVLFEQEIEMFIENPLIGIGVGNVSEIRYKKYRLPHTSHTEYSRLLAEHGIWGGCAVLIMLIVPLVWIFKTQSGYTTLFAIAFFLYSLLIMIPASTRTALPIFLYGLAFVQINKTTVNGKDEER